VKERIANSNWQLALGLLCCLAMLGFSSGNSQTSIREEKISYLSGKLKINARVWFPAGNGVAPSVLYNHGGISGLSSGTLKRCRELAQAGFIVFASSYRGEDGSDGRVEVSKGEVDDVLAGMNWLKTQARVDPKRMSMMGTSHGALVGLLAAARTNELRALVFAYGVSDIYKWYRYLIDTKQLANDQLTKDTYGNGPSDRPQSFAIRNGLSFLPKISSSMPTLILQGEKDSTVPLEQAQFLFDGLQKLERPVILKTYPNSGHGFINTRDALKGVQLKESLAAWKTALEFLKVNTH
jgi:dipeptidyl aminopeptidase/acylaminoacyl peptidase